MAKTYTELRNLYGTLTKNTSSANLTLGDQLINDEYRAMCHKKNFYFLYKTRTLTTTASTQFKDLPYDVDQVMSVYVTVSSTRYTPRPVHSRAEWDRLNTLTYTSDIPQFYFVYNDQLGLWPTPATSSNTITINAKIRVLSLAIADYTTGTISAATNGSTSITGSGTSWTAPMAGRWLRITQSDSANTGDDRWYEIASVGGGTSITLLRGYGGTSISAGSASYTIGQVPLLPEEVQDAPVYRAASIYWSAEGDPRGKTFGDIYKEKMEILMKYRTGPITNPVVDVGDDYYLPNPNLFITAS